MPNHNKIRRYSLLLEKLEGQQYPTTKDILEYLKEHDLGISKRTFTRERSELRNEFGIDIIYDKQRKGFNLENEVYDKQEAFMRFLEIAGIAALLTESLKENKDTLNYISFDSFGLLKGIGYLKDILYAIKNHRLISFEHQKFISDKAQKYVVMPYLLREYQNRWYLFGIEEHNNEFRTFGIDRIMKLKVESNTFKPNLKIDAAEQFQSTIGITYNKPAEKIILSFTPLQGKYVKTLPWHLSQKIIKDNDKELVIERWVHPNYELERRILMEGENVTVIKPKWLADTIKKSLAEALKKYK